VRVLECRSHGRVPIGAPARPICGDNARQPAMTHLHSDQTWCLSSRNPLVVHARFLRASTVFRSRCALVCPCSLDPHHGRLVLAARYQSHGFLSPRQAPKRTAARSLLTLPASHPCLGSFLHPSPKESAPTRHRRRAMRLVRRPPTSLPSVVPLRRRTPVTATPT
jgi:hypothetical protein